MSLTVSDWTMEPVKGASGNAYHGKKGSEEAFIKLDASPLLMSLYQEGISPKILWNKRADQGGMLSAQDWIDGGTLEPSEMMDTQVNQLLAKVHTSKRLIETSEKMGNEPVKPTQLIQEVIDHSSGIYKYQYLKTIIDELKATMPDFEVKYLSIVHGDVNHNNWLKEKETGRIYLVDWDAAFLAERLIDDAHILSHYILPVDWSRWLLYSGYQPRDVVMKKLAWYGKLSFLRQITGYLATENFRQVNQEIAGLRKFSEQFNQK